MGYTHYWTFKTPSKIKGNADRAEIAYQKAIDDCSKIARVYNAECRANGLDMDRLSGFTAHCKKGKYGGVLINGKQENAHEDFSAREHFRQNFEDGLDGSNFCKTARKPYDIVVVACLAVLKHRLGDLIDVSSDGNAKDWTQGLELARRVTGLKIENPIKAKAA